MNEVYKIRKETITEIADAIRAKANKTDLISPLDMAEEILLLQLGDVDFASQTAMEDNVEEGYTFYNRYGLLVTGTGTSLNFKIVGSASQPVSPTENTIWVETDTEVAGFQFSPNQPQTRANGSALVTGDVWIITSPSGDVSFNALKKDGIMVCADGCFQWDGAEWAYKNSWIYANGDWQSLKNALVYVDSEGVHFDEIGDMTLITYNSVTEKDNQLVISSAKGSDSDCPTAFAENKVNLTGRSTITITFQGGTIYHPIVFGVHNDKATSWDKISTKCAPYGTEQINNGNSSIKNMNTFTYDVSQFSGDYYLFVGGLRNSNYGSTITIKEWYIN